jgi:hypothetical protein
MLVRIEYVERERRLPTSIKKEKRKREIEKTSRGIHKFSKWSW